MGQILILNIFAIIFALQLTNASVVTRSTNEVERKANFERELQEETLHFLNDILQSQVDYYTKVKLALPAGVKRIQEIEAYIARLQETIRETNLDKKDVMWSQSFKQFDKSTLVVNKQDETGLTDEAYEKILNDNGLDEMVKNYFKNIAIYFWKMARASGKIVADTIEEHLRDLQTKNNHN